MKKKKKTPKQQQYNKTENITAYGIRKNTEYPVNLKY